MSSTVQPVRCATCVEHTRTSSYMQLALLQCLYKQLGFSGVLRIERAASHLLSLHATARSLARAQICISTAAYGTQRRYLYIRDRYVISIVQL
jgi:hypothetical protein